MSRKTVSLFTGNHLEWGVSDQIDYLNCSLGDAGLDVILSKKLNEKFDNIVIENFQNFEVDQLYNFKNNYENTKIFCVLTEHFELRHGVLYLNDERFDAERSYIPNLYMRFLNLVKISPVFSGFITLHQNPSKANLRTIFPLHPIFEFRGIPKPKTNLQNEKLKQYDMCFFGTMTPYRKQILQQLRDKFNIFIGSSTPSNERAKIIKNSVINLNIPQSDKWTNISPMRVFSSSKLDVFTLTITDDDSNNNIDALELKVSEACGMLISDILYFCHKNLDKSNVYLDQKFKIDGFDQWVN